MSFSFNPLQRGELPATRNLLFDDQGPLDVSIPSNAGNYLPLLVQQLLWGDGGVLVSIPSNAGNYLPPHRHAQDDCDHVQVSIPSNAGNYLPPRRRPSEIAHRCVSIPSNAGNYLPLANVATTDMDLEVKFQSPPTRGTTCHFSLGLPKKILKFQSPPTRGTTCHWATRPPQPSAAVSIPSNAGNYLPHHEDDHLGRGPDVFQSPPTRGTTCHGIAAPSRRGIVPAVSIPSNAGNYLPLLRGARHQSRVRPGFNPLQRGELPATDGTPNPRRIATAEEFQSPPTRGTTCHKEGTNVVVTGACGFNPLQRGELPATSSATRHAPTGPRFNPLQRGELPATDVASARQHASEVSIPSNAGNYLPRGDDVASARQHASGFNPLQRGELPATSITYHFSCRDLIRFNPLQRGELPATGTRGGSRKRSTRVSIPSNAGNYLPLEVAFALADIEKFQSPPTRGTTCHKGKNRALVTVGKLFQSPPTRGTTCHRRRSGDGYPHGSGCFNPLQRGELPATRADFDAGKDFVLQFQSPPTRGTTCHYTPCPSAIVRKRVSIPSNAGNYLPLQRGRMIPKINFEGFNPLQRGELPATPGRAQCAPPRRVGGFNPLQRGELPATIETDTYEWELYEFQSPPTRGTTCHLVAGSGGSAGSALSFNPLQRGELPATRRCQSWHSQSPIGVSIPSNAGNYLPRGFLVRRQHGRHRVSIPSNAGNYLPRKRTRLHQLLPGGGFNPLQRGELPATTMQSRGPSRVMCFNPLQRGELPATLKTSHHVNPLDVKFQSPPTRGTTCHARRQDEDRHCGRAVSIPSNAGNYLPHR